MKGHFIINKLKFYVMILFLPLLSFAVEFSVTDFVTELFSSSTISNEKYAAVLPFETQETHSDGDLGVAFAEFLITDIVQNSRAQLVDRTQLKTIIEEMTLSESGIIDESQMLELGKLSSAAYIVSGKVTKAIGSYLVTAQLINTETSEILGAAKMTIPVSSANDEIAKLYQEHNYPRESAFRSLLIPGWGQFYSGEKAHGILSSSLCAIGLGVSIYIGVNQHNYYVDYEAYRNLTGADYLEEQQRVMDSLQIINTEADLIITEIGDNMYDEYNAKRKAFAISTGITGGLWALNVFDAILTGKKAEKQYQLYFASNPFTQTYSATIAYKF